MILKNHQSHIGNSCLTKLLHQGAINLINIKAGIFK